VVLRCVRRRRFWCHRSSASSSIPTFFRAAHAQARARFWELHGAPQQLTIDVDATLINSHSEEEKAAGDDKGGYGFHPLQAYLDETRESLGGLLRPGNAGSNTAEDHTTVTLQILVRSDSAGATHGLVDYCRDGNLRFSVGYDLGEKVRAQILQIPKDGWVTARNPDGSERGNGEIAEITSELDLSTWPMGSRVIVRRERPHPGAQLSFTDVDGYHFQAILTDQTDSDIGVVECRHRQHAHVEDRIREDKTTGLGKFPFKDFTMNEAWLQIVSLAHDLLIWTQALCLDGHLAKAELKRLRYQLLHVATRLAFSGRRAKLHLQTPGPGPASSSPRSPSSRRSQPRAADPHHATPRRAPPRRPVRHPRQVRHSVGVVTSTRPSRRFRPCAHARRRERGRAWRHPPPQGSFAPRQRSVRRSPSTARCPAVR
jgi:hypothetical protein